MSGAVALEQAGAVATLTIDNPPVNALAERILEELGAAIREVASEPATRALVLTGAGSKAFAAGADLEELRGALGDREAMAHHVGVTGPVFAALTELEVPVIAAVAGSAVGGGLELALACDLIVAAPKAKLGFPEVRLGLIPGAGGTQRLPRRVGVARAMQMLTLGSLADAESAHRFGLVDVLADELPPLETAVALAERIAAQPGLAVRGAKRAVRAATAEPLEAGLRAERELFLDLALTADAAEGASAFLERREARFQHR